MEVWEYLGAEKLDLKWKKWYFYDIQINTPPWLVISPIYIIHPNMMEKNSSTIFMKFLSRSYGVWFYFETEFRNQKLLLIRSVMTCSGMCETFHFSSEVTIQTMNALTLRWSTYWWVRIRGRLVYKGLWAESL